MNSGSHPYATDRSSRARSSTKQLELHVANVYMEVAQMLQEVPHSLHRKETLKYNCPLKLELQLKE